MMRKKIVSLCMALALCLSLLPVTALAEENAPTTLYVGDQSLPVGRDSCWTTDANTGKLTEYTTGGDEWTVKYEPTSATLTLKNATIKGVVENIASAGIYAASSSGPVSLNIVLVGENEVTGGYGINVSSEGAASLSITGSGSLTVSGLSGNGIGIFMSSQNSANLTIEEASVTALGSQVGGSGVRLITSQTGSPSLTIEVKGGSLQASGETNGIHFLSNVNDATAVANLKVSGNAMVKASSITTTKDGTGSAPELKPAASGSDGAGGIIWDGKDGTVYGDVTLQEDLTIGEDESLDIPSGASLTIGSGATLTNEGTVTNNGTLTNNGTIDNSGTLTGTISGNAPPSITTTSPLARGTVGTEYSVTLEANNSTSGWSVTSGSLPDGLTLDGNTGLISGTPTTAGTSTFTVKAANDYGSDSKELSIIIDEQTDVPVTGVTLNKTSTSLYVGDTETLTATVAPDNATNKAVTWTSSNPSVATVENGVVTALARGTAVITATAADGNGASAACTVTVTRPYIPPANPNYRITVEATQGGTVTADPTAAKAGTTVTLTPVPDRGYQVGTVAVTDRFGEAVAVTEQADGTYTFTMPNGQVTVTVTFEQAPLPFPDVTEGDWFYDAVRYAYETGLMDGVGDNLFAPNSQTTRAQLVTILYRLAGEPEPGGDSGFSDVAAGIWYTDAVAWAAQNGIVNGVSDTEFAPGDDITREQLAAILYRYAAYQGYDVSQRADLSGFGDAESISGYAQEALSWAHAQGLVLGFEDGSLRPQGTASRAQIAAVLMRFLAAVPMA